MTEGGEKREDKEERWGDKEETRGRVGGEK